jgi:hypothetical protein
MTAHDWIKFVREYGPVPSKDNLFDENLRRRSKRLGIAQVEFKHPFEDPVLACFEPAIAVPRSVILTGTAGDGKTFLCARVWEKLHGDPAQWNSKATHFQIPVSWGEAEVVLHIIRDLSAWVPEQGAAWPEDKRELMVRFAASLFEAEPKEYFLIAGNDGQLGETFRRLDHAGVARAWGAIEDLLVAGKSEKADVRLRLFNLSQGSSVIIFHLAVEAFLGHEGWKVCAAEAAGPDGLFGTGCPIRRNYEILGLPQTRARLASLLELCDQNGLHVPIRQILILLANAVLGHPKVKDGLMVAADVPTLLAAGTRHQASIYNNLFGGNLSVARRGGSAIFDYFERFQIGTETTNRFDNILIFGESHSALQKEFDQYLANDDFYGADPAYLAAKREYVEGGDENPETAQSFLDLLVSQRRALFFKITAERSPDLQPWDLTVFRYGGEYLADVLPAVRSNSPVKRTILARLVRGTNRIFTGMLVGSDRELLLASSASLSQARVCRFLDDKLSVAPRRGERVEIVAEGNYPWLRVDLGDGLHCHLQLTLTRYEYLSRVAEGAMPSSFSKECFEDVMAFKSRLMRELAKRSGGEVPTGELLFRVLGVDASGGATEEPIGVTL